MEKEYLIKKWLNGELSETEWNAFKQLDDYPELTGIVDNATLFKASGFSAVDDFETFSTRLKGDTMPVKKLNWHKPFLKIAAVVFMALALSYLVLYNREVTITTLAAEKTAIELPDASTVVINALSEVKYSKYKWKGKREVNLVGEAFFKVAKGAKFNVLTSEGIVSVVGTQFNVKQRGSFFEVVCFEGVVNVTSRNTSERLKGGERFRFAQGKVSLGKTTDLRPQWTKNISSFERVPLSEVLAELERQYNIKVQMEKINPDQLFTGGFAHDNLDNALKAIAEPLGLAYRIEAGKWVQLYTIDE